MKVAVVGSRKINNIDIEKYLPQGVREIVSGGATGVDQCAAEYARKRGLILREFLPQYERYGRAAPIIRNREIVDYAEYVIVFWDGVSRGALSVIEYAKQKNKCTSVIICDNSDAPSCK